MLLAAEAAEAALEEYMVTRMAEEGAEAMEEPGGEVVNTPQL